MSSSTLDPKATPAGAGGEQTSAEGAKPARRYRRPVSRAKKAAATTETTPTTGAQSEAAQAPQAEPTPPAETTAAEQRPAEQAAQTPQAETRARGAARGQRGQRGERRGTGRKGGVQLVIPANGTAESAPQEATEQAEERQESVASAEPRIVPVVTHTPGAETPAPAGETAAPAEAAAATPQAGPTRRYRFERRPSSATAPAAAIRPERLASQQTLPAASAVGQPVEAEQRAEPETVPQAPSAEQPEAAEPHVTPAAPAAKAPDLFGARGLTEPLHTDAVTSDAVDDIVAALGLRGAQPRRAEPQPVEEVISTPAPEVVSEEGAEAEEAGEQAEEAHAGGEGQPSARRRRRRRRSSPHAAHEAEEGEEQPTPTGEAGETLATLTQPAETGEERATRNGAERYGDFGPFEQPYTPYTPGAGYTGYGRATREQPAAQQPWDIGEAQGQIRQSESPFGAPEPSFARGFGPQPRGVAGPAREFYPRTGRTERTEAPPISPNQVGSMVTQAIQQQTDRLLAELRHQQMPPSMTVMFPPFPTTERVGVFVDVANVLYSSRSMRVSLDFGRLLDFLRGNRRLTRAHAYAPTNPDPNAEQSFLSVVKGLGYRITTKNYKTFSSGAKKADLDLDMCMDIVRLVDSGAVDTIVLVSGDSDFLPLLEYCSDKGVRVEVAAFDDSAAMILRQSCDLFINLSLVDDIRA